MSTTKLEFDQLEESLERVAKKQKVTFGKTLKSIDSLILEVCKCKEKLSVDSMETDEEQDDVKKALAQLKETLSANKTIEDHKELHAPISKLGKVIERSFRCDLEKSLRPNIKFDNRIIDQVIAQHLYRQGRFSVADTFAIGDAKMDPEMARMMKTPFVQMHTILEAMVKKDLEPAIKWARSFRSQLEKMGSSLEFKLHRLQFVQLLASGQQGEALQYARKHFSEFSHTHMSEIQKLMGSFVYTSRLTSSPYSNIFHPTHLPSLWADVEHTFQKDSCSMIGLSQESPLYVAITAGWKALPTFIKLASFQVLLPKATPAPAPKPPSSGLSLASSSIGSVILQTLAPLVSFSSGPSSPTPEGSGESSSSSNNNNNNNQNEQNTSTATVEVDIGKEYQFHSVFACPVSREQSTKDNPPMMLICGHVLSKASLQKLVKGPSARLKCPYCPSEQISNQARQLYF
eukprot:TRINITY_DN8579_c0_g3_i1.p1 TRINITY_DN8579_c0_g3~~TRINITY_DN8579_c0_g3_i1.p1  ORF type:complete len:459 (+),score=99.44 TRINITY_DN8579_c0_g3_i1:244-1620(+)